MPDVLALRTQHHQPRACLLRFGANIPSRGRPLPEIRPTNQAPIIKPGGKVEMLRWGLENSWGQQTSDQCTLGNTGEEKTFHTPTGKPMFGSASAYFEWRKDARQRIKTHIAPVDRDLIAFAGLFDDDRFTIITCIPSSAIAHIHGRMPVILTRQNEQDWLNGGISIRKSSRKY